MFIGGKRVPPLMSIEFQWFSLELAGVSGSGHITGGLCQWFDVHGTGTCRQAISANTF
jgi:hypothetical protein